MFCFIPRYLAEYTVDVWRSSDGKPKTVTDIINAGGWVCAMNPWDPLHNSCDAPQDVALSTSYYFDTYVDYPEDDPRGPAGGGDADDEDVSQEEARDMILADPALFKRKLTEHLKMQGLGEYPTKIALGGKPLDLYELFTRVRDALRRMFCECE